MQASFRALNASSALSVYLKAFSFLVSSVSGMAILEKFWINYQLKLTKLIKAYTSFTVVGVGQSLTTLIFSGLILTPFFPTMHPRNSTSSWCYLHLSESTNSKYYCSSLRTVCTYFLYSSSLCEYISMLSK
jgi:hypothetical protein